MPFYAVPVLQTQRCQLEVLNKQMSSDSHIFVVEGQELPFPFHSFVVSYVSSCFLSRYYLGIRQEGYVMYIYIGWFSVSMSNM